MTEIFNDEYTDLIAMSGRLFLFTGFIAHIEITDKIKEVEMIDGEQREKGKLSQMFIKKDNITCFAEATFSFKVEDETIVVRTTDDRLIYHLGGLL